MSALGLAQVLWDERQALAGKPLHFPPAPNPAKASGGPGASSGDCKEQVRDVKLRQTAPQEPEHRPQKMAEIYQKLNTDNRWALCLSGGGIRSAAFALGILQRFAAREIAPKRKGDKAGSALQQFEYLSTVSGGGYIGSWLSAWLLQERKKHAPAAMGKTGSSQALDANEVVAALNQRLTDVVDRRGRVRDHEEVECISNLRRDSHYLAPSFSPISPDLWSGLAGILRNLFLNWILLVPPMILAVLVTKALAYAFIDAGDINNQSTWFVLVMIAATVCFVIALSFAAANRPARGLINATQPLFLVCDMSVFLIGAVLLIFVLGSPNGQETLSSVIRAVGLRELDNVESRSLVGAVLLRGALLGVAIYFASWCAAPLWRKVVGTEEQPPLESEPWGKWLDLGTWCLAGAVFGALIGAGLLILFYFYPPDQPKSGRSDIADGGPRRCVGAPMGRVGTHHRRGDFHLVRGVRPGGGRGA
jgi:hypothetical protein